MLISSDRGIKVNYQDNNSLLENIGITTMELTLWSQLELDNYEIKAFNLRFNYKMGYCGLLSQKASICEG